MRRGVDYVPSPKHTDAVLEFLPPFEREDFKPSKVEARPGHVPYHVFSEELNRFNEAVYENGFVYSFNWGE